MMCPQSNLMDKSFLHIKVISIYLLISAVCRISYSCSGFPAQGYTYPKGDISIEYNTSTPLEITCVITNKTLISQFPNVSSHLSFKKDQSYVSRDKIIRLNETSIKFVEEKPEKMSSFFSCMLNGSAVCLNNVAVGTKPQPIMDFSCIARNYENLTCLWTPLQNYVTTNYSLSYTFPRWRSGKYKNDNPPQHYPNLKTKSQSRHTDCNVTDDEETGKKKCFWGLHTTPHYRQVQHWFNFTLKSVNRFGSLEQVFLFDHYKHILAAPPENLTCINSTTSSLLLYWKIPENLVPFDRGLEHRVLYQCRFGPKTWQNGGLRKSSEEKNVTFNLTGLRYAHDVCDIRVAIRVQSSDSEDMWSSNSSITALTSSTIPGAPPRVDIGSFQVDVTTNLREIYVYWQQIPIELRNADNFHYIVTAEDVTSNATNVRPSEMKASYARFSNMSLYASYRFIIRSNNSEGPSVDSAELLVPSNDKLMNEPVSFTKVAFDNGIYKLSWEPPRIGAEYVQNYTLFWCGNEKDRPYQCIGHLNWTVVPADVREYNITVEEEYITQFAVSANNATSSSGMVWATCTVIHNKGISKIKEVWITKVGKTFMKLGWKLDCADKSDNVAGYIVYYCPRAKELACLTSMMNITINNPNAESAEIKGLKPYTTYMLMVSVFNKQGSKSRESDPVLNTTFEDAPSEPYGLKVDSVTNSSITVTWKPPQDTNGYLRNYFVYINNNSTDTGTNQTMYTFKNLQLGTVYNISVSACTLECSMKSAPIAVRTKTGRPSEITTLWPTTENKTLFVKWMKPSTVGENAYYEIRSKSGSSYTIVSNITVSESQYSVLECDTSDKYHSYKIAVRAVNTDGNTTKYVGPWSKDVDAVCNGAQRFSVIWVVFIALICLALIFLVVFSGKRCYVYYNEMKTVDVKLPPGLDPQIDTSWTQPKPNTSPSDEERLLNKMFTTQCVDSSGCSSGQSSTTFDSGSSANNSMDSGTEQSKPPGGDEPKTLLIAENITKAGEIQPYVQFSEQTPWCNGSNNNNGYSMYGVSDIELTNVSAPENGAGSPSYAACDQIKMQVGEASAYVPVNSVQDKDIPYVLAANKSMMPNLFYNKVSSHDDNKTYVQVADANGVLKNAEMTRKESAPSENAAVNNTDGYVSFGEAPKSLEMKPAGDGQVASKSNGYISFGESPQRSAPLKEDTMHGSNGYVSFGEAPVSKSPYVPNRM